MDRDEISRISKELEEMLVVTEKNKKEPGTESKEEALEESETLKESDALEEPDASEEPDLPDYDPEELLDRYIDEFSVGNTLPKEKRLGMNREPEKKKLDEVRREVAKPAASAERNRRSMSLIRPSDGLVAAFFVPIIIMIIIFAQRGIFPFGEESFLRTDMYHQYAPFFSEFQYKLTHGESLLYSWNVGMGVNFMALYAYYLASPLNWLLIFCPKGLIIEFMTYMIVFKIGLSGLTFAYYLRKHHGTRDFGVAFFGIFYALSGYMAAYSWNIMWLDCILLFPLIILGLERLVKERRCFLYCITLGLSILSNYYISIMICAFMVFYFIALLIMEKGKTVKDYIVNIVQFSIFSLAAGGLAAIVLLPEIFALQATASGKFSFPKSYTSYFSIFDMIARHINNVQSEIGLDHWPNIYCGVAVLMFFLLYLACKKIAIREKVVYCALLLFLFASFSINVLNFIWHGFHYPNSLPARQSFIYIFLMLFICYQAYIHLRSTPWKHIVIAFWGAACFVLLAQKLATETHYHFIVFYVALGFLALYAGLIFLYQKGKNRNLLILLTLGLVSLEAAVNMTVTSVTTTGRTNYIADNEAVAKLVKKLDSAPTFYRVEKVSRKTKNDGAWMNFPSVSLFSSTANADLSAFFKKLGCESSTNAYSITGSTPLVDSLFSVRYALYSEKPSKTGLLTILDRVDRTFLYENSFTLPVAFMLPQSMEENWSVDTGNPADVQNDLANVIGARPVLEEIGTDIAGTSLSFTPELSGDYYVYVSNKKIEKVTATIGSNSKSFNNVNRGYFLELGYIREGVEVRLQSDGDGQDLVASVYRFAPEGLESVYTVLNRNPLVLNHWTDTLISGTVTAEKDGLLYTSIPYDKGWTVLVDGEKRRARKVFNTFLSVEVPAGDHMVEFHYMPEGLKLGAAITGGSILFLILVLLLSRAAARVRDEKEFAEELERGRES